ncbi:PhnD/SsuA/transferrin family substrate-binding protein [Nocardioides sp. zg-579]|uniref:PhnD/SsuA/transferrin family substrate-binding protein n=1 Tax=Nocardioides marmotae TaxID=2663857 RepID=A0A6I3J702_9ACTN|nr:ABC transporter substrate-binding protein [Nocardioides marmotae]MCR6029919.1 PhnD/SsuA/transferrin family substrate-binding protein [Gordonia jinghuaiqii]MTB93549.1 PhnD/SsuA/transferrin family substrate-binding protein [Nocardioides marmotae]QKD99919.1 ABC transporter substrate-binding protein [Nocardioides marmotae]
MAQPRLRALAATAVALLVSTSACSSAEGEDSSESSVQVSVFPSFNGLPTFAAQETDIFGDHDLEVEISTAKTASEMVPQVVGGKVDFALLDAATSLVAAAQGVDLVFVAAGTEGGIPEGQEEFSFANVWVAEDSDIEDMSDLSGKTIGIPQIKSLPWVDVRSTVDAAGGDSSTIEFVETPDTLAALKSGQVDAVTTSEPAGSVEKAAGVLRTLGPVNSGGGGVAYLWVTTRAFAEANPDTVEAFAEAINEAGGTLNEDRDLLVDTAVDVVGADRALLEKASYPTYATEPLDEAAIGEAVDYLDSYAMFEKGAPDPADLVAP